MAISARCPSCGASFLLDEELAGKYVRCRDCQNTFLVPAGTAIEPRRHDPDAGWEEERDRDRPRRREEEDDEPRRRRRRSRREDSESDSTGTVLLWVFGVIGGVMLLLAAVCGGTIWYVTTRVGRAVDQA